METVGLGFVLEAPFLRKMYMAHDLQSISRRALDRGHLHRSLGIRSHS